MAKTPKATSEPSALSGTRSSAADVAAFLARTKTLAPSSGGRGRLIFAMDATMSRQPSWDLALSLQAEMFRAVQDVGGLDVKLVYFRGMGECRASHWVSEPQALARVMAKVECLGGFTQIGKVLGHARREGTAQKVHALVYVGDCMEEHIDDLSQQAGALGLLGVPVFLFQEGRDPRAASGFKEIARLSRGAHCSFDAGSASQLRDLLKAVAVYASGGRKALADFGKAGASRAALQLLDQIG